MKLFQPFVGIFLLFFFGCSSNSNPLMSAVQKGDLSKVQQLLKQEPELALLRNEERDAALHLAVRNGNVEIVRIFVNAHADLDLQNEQGDTPLILATDIGYYPIVKLLLEGGADFSVVDNHGRSAPKLALEDHKPDLLDLFLKKGVSKEDLYLPLIPTRTASQENTKSWTTLEGDLYAAATGGQQEKFDQLLEEGGRDGLLHLSNKDENGDTLLGKLAQLMSPFYMEHLLQKDHTALDVSNKAGMAPLSLAIMAAQVQNARILILSGASLRTSDRALRGVLHLAVLSKNEEMFTLILRNTHSFSEQDIQGNTPLHYAAQDKDHPEILKMLLESGANVNIQNKALGDTPLAMAVKADNEEGAALLLKFGANPKIANIEGDTPVSFARGTPMAQILS